MPVAPRLQVGWWAGCGVEKQNAAQGRVFAGCLAERVGFEPTCRVSPTIRFRVGAVMATSVPLRREGWSLREGCGLYGVLPVLGKRPAARL